MILTDADVLARDLMAQYGLTDWGWSFRFDCAKVRLGLCSFRRKTISLSKALVLLNSREEVLDTLLHEIAHALVGVQHGHDLTWKLKARSLGARPEACAPSSAARVEGKYIGECTTCRKRVSRHRRPKDTRYFHTMCRGRLNNGLISWAHQQ